MNENRFEEDYGARQYIGHAFSSSTIVLLHLHVRPRDFCRAGQQIAVGDCVEPGQLMINLFR
jgi:hypothetical protein